MNAMMQNMNQMMNQQNQTTAALLAMLNQSHQVASVPPPPPPVAPQSRLAEFMRTRPLTFSSSLKPLGVDDWLRSTEKSLPSIGVTTVRRSCMLHTSWKVQPQNGGRVIMPPMQATRASLWLSFSKLSVTLMSLMERWK